jgi:hypothetical protein
MTEPIACTLTTADLAHQRERWTALLARAGTARIETADGLRLEFADAAGVEHELRELVAVETDCCRWATWSVTRDGGTLAMEARSTDDGVAALHGMFARGAR